MHSLGVELDWLAVDEAGHVGLFSSGGRGPVPIAVLDHMHDVEEALQRLIALPIQGECSESPRGGGNYNFWIEPARRGLFGYDFGAVPQGPFARVAVPSVPLIVTELADFDVRKAALLVRIPIDLKYAPHVAAIDLGVELDPEPGSC